jgi:hypothetical protein
MAEGLSNSRNTYLMSLWIELTVANVITIAAVCFVVANTSVEVTRELKNLNTYHTSYRIRFF